MGTITAISGRRLIATTARLKTAGCIRWKLLFFAARGYGLQDGSLLP
jgi:hypothetical protein